MSYFTDKSDTKFELRYALVEDASGIHFETKRQTVDIVETKLFGQALFLDSCLQSTQKDEFIYHEHLVHPIMQMAKKREKVLVLGGAEGCTLREICKYIDVKEIVQVDWDEELVGLFYGDYSWNNGAYSDYRVRTVFEDAMEFLKNDTTKYDVIIVDLLDPSSDTMPFMKDLLKEVVGHLTETGIFVCNGGRIRFSGGDACEELAAWLRYEEMMPAVFPGKFFVPSFCDEWCLLFGLRQHWKKHWFLAESFDYIKTRCIEGSTVPYLFYHNWLKYDNAFMKALT